MIILKLIGVVILFWVLLIWGLVVVDTRKKSQINKEKGKILSVSGEGDLLSTIDGETVKVCALEKEEGQGGYSFIWDPDEQ